MLKSYPPVRPARSMGRGRIAVRRARSEPLERRVLLAGAHHWPAGPEVQVNSGAVGFEFEYPPAAIAMDADGDYVIAWNTGGYGYYQYSDVYACRYNSAGEPLGSEFRVNTFTASDQYQPAVAMDADGDFVVAWVSWYQDGHDAGVYAQRYDAAGVALGSEFRVNSYTPDDQFEPTVAMDADGDFVIAWTSWYQDGSVSGIYAQRYDAVGAAEGSEFRVNSYTPLWQDSPSAAMDADGDFVIAWLGSGHDGLGIVGQRFDAAGVAQGAETLLAAYSPGVDLLSHPSVAMDADGDFVVTWEFRDAGYFQPFGIRARRYEATGVPQGASFDVQTGTTRRPRGQHVAMNAHGEFIVTWESLFGDDRYGPGAYVQRYDAAGLPLGTQFRVSTTGTLLAPTVAIADGGDFVVAARAETGAVRARRSTTFGAAGAATIGDRVWNDSNADGIQGTGEAGLAGATIELSSADGAGIAIVTSGTTGQYSIAGLAGASAQLRFATPAGFLTTRQDQGGDDQLDSDIDRATGLTQVFSVGAAGTSNSSLDAGFSLPASVGGIVFYDRSGDGIRNGGEEALAGFEVFVDFDGDGVMDSDEPAATTDSAGSYAFTGLLGGAYRIVVVDQDQWFEPSLPPVAIPPGAALTQINRPVRTSAHDTISLPQSGPFRANAYTTDVQRAPSAAMDADGDFVVAWDGAGQGDSYGIYAQRYNADGIKQGDEFRVNTSVNGTQVSPSVAMDTSGDFVIAWFGAGSGDDYGIFAQRYNAAGAKQGTEFRVNTYTTREQGGARVAMDGDGDFVIAWHSYGQDGGLRGIYAQRYSAGGVRQGAEFHVNTYIGSMFSPSVAMDAEGDFVIAWSSYYQDGAYNGVFAQRYDAVGLPQGEEFRVNTSTERNEFVPSVAMEPDGDFVVAWGSALHIDPPYTPYDIYVQRYNASGVPQGTEILVNSFTTGIQAFPKAAIDSDGDFIVTWHSADQDGSGYGVYGQRYNAAGVPQRTEASVNTYTSGDQTWPSVAMDSAGNYVVAWMGAGDGDSDGVYAQRYSVSPRPAVTASEFVWQTAPQRIEFTFDQDVSASLGSGDIVLENLTTGTTVPAADIAVSWNASSRTATFSFPSLPNGGSLPDGTYGATLLSAGVFNTSGTTIAVDWALTFFVLAGDANHDGVVNLRDFNILAANFGQSPRDFTQGDFTYDGVVNLSDFNLLASRFGQIAAPSSRPGSDAADADSHDSDERLEQLL